jgi:hypothetical protein
MRAYEIEKRLNEENHFKTGDTPSSGITLRHLNRLKRARKRNKRDRDQKLALLPVMYSGERLQELENLEADITGLIDAAKLGKKSKDHISDMALRAIKKNESKG